MKNIWDDYLYRENGVSFAVIFDGSMGDVAQCAILDGDVTPITGTNVQFLSNTVRNGGANITYEAIPMELLVTNSNSPVITASVNGLEVLCPALNCDYAYVAAVGSVTGQSLSGNVITVTGTGLPTTDFDIIFGEQSCDTTTITATATTASCTLLGFPAAGSWSATVRSASGDIPSTGLVDISV